MLADAVAAHRGVWFANEPFAVLPGHPEYDWKRAQLPEVKHSHFFALQGEALDRFHRYVDGLLGARFRKLGTCRRTTFPLVADRVCLKVLNVPWMIDFFATETDAHVVSCIRHPAAQSLSVLRQGWQFPVEAYAMRSDALATRFSSDEVESVLRNAADGDDWRIAILDWVVTSQSLRRPGTPSVICTKYEDIVLNPEVFVDTVLIGQCGLTERQRMIATFGRPSGSSRMNEAAATRSILSGGKLDLIEGWRSKVTPDMARAGQAILDEFGVTEYSFS
jgi:hypothetical protein